MAATITTGNFPRLLQEGLYSTFGNTYDQREKLSQKIFAQKTSNKAFEVSAQVEGFGYAAEKPEGQELQFDSRRQGFTPKYVMTTYAKGFVATEEAIEDNLYDIMLGDAKSLAISMGVTEETVAWNILNRGFNSAYTMIDGDGQPLFSASHQLGATNTNTYSNLLGTAAAFSEASLEDLLIQIDKAVDSRGFTNHIAS